PKKTTASTPNDYPPVALTPIIMKCFEKLVLSHITTSLPHTFDSHQFAYRGTHVEQRGNYARLLFIDFSSAFNTIIPSRLVTKLMDLGLSQQICYWIRNFLTDRSQRVRVGSHLSSALSISIGSPQGC